MPTPDSLYPCLIPSFKIVGNQLFWGNSSQFELSNDELLFLECCTGSIEFSILKEHIENAEQYLQLFRHVLIELPEEIGLLEKESSRTEVLVISPHGYEGFLSLGGSIAKWSQTQVVKYVSCFGRQAQSLSNYVASSVELNASRADETAICARICGSTNKSLNFPDHEFARRNLYPGDFEEKYKAVSSALRMSLFQEIKSLQPSKVFCPAGLGGHRDGTLVYSLMLDFYKRDVFPEVDFYFYEEFPFSQKYSQIDDLYDRASRAFVKLKESHNDISDYVNIKRQMYLLHSTLFHPEDQHLIEHIQRRGNALANSPLSKGRETYHQLLFEESKA